jgi:hypothetical protein
MPPMRLNTAEYVVKVLGGVRPTGRALNRHSSAVCRWRQRGAIPVAMQQKILTIAERYNLDIKPEDLIRGRVIEGYRRPQRKAS